MQPCKYIHAVAIISLHSWKKVEPWSLVLLDKIQKITQHLEREQIRKSLKLCGKIDGIRLDLAKN